MVIFVQLCKCNLPQREDQGIKQHPANQSITLPLCPKLKFCSTWERCHLVSLVAAMRRAAASLKPALQLQRPRRFGFITERHHSRVYHSWGYRLLGKMNAYGLPFGLCHKFYKCHHQRHLQVLQMPPSKTLANAAS